MAFPPLDAISTTWLPSRRYSSGMRRRSPLFAPVVSSSPTCWPRRIDSRPPDSGQQHAVDPHRHVDEVPGADARAGEVLGLAVHRADADVGVPRADLRPGWVASVNAREPDPSDPARAPRRRRAHAPARRSRCRIDQTLLQDATGTMALMQFEQLEVPRVQVERAVQYVDHNVIQLDFKNPDDHRMLQALCRRYGIHYSRPGNGICHYVHIERFARPGGILVGADSHTTTSGALGMIAIGAGGLDVAVAMAGHPYEIACPEVVEVHLASTLAPALGPGQGRDPRAAAPPDRARRQEQGVRVHRPRHRRPERARARHDRQHDRRAGRHRGRLPARRQHPRVAAPPAARGRLRRARARAPAATTTTAWRSTSPSSGRWWPSRRTPTTSCRSRRWPARRSSRSASARRSTPPTSTWRCPGAVLGDGHEVHERVTATATPGSRQILVAIAESGVYRQLVEGGVRMLEPVCGPCVGMGQAPPSDANSLRTFNRNFPGRSGTPDDQVYLCSPAVAAVSMLHGEIRDPREQGEPPELLEMPELKPYVDDRHIFPPAPEDEADQIEIPRGPNIKTPPEHEPLEPRAERADRDRPARQHLDRRPRPRRRDRHVLPLEHPRDRRVHLPAPRPRVPQAHAGVGQRASSSAGTTTARAPRASTPRSRRCSSACAPCSRSRSRASTGATWSPRGSWRSRSWTRPTTTAPRWGRPGRCRTSGRSSRTAPTRSRVEIEERATSSRVTHDFAPKEREILLHGGLLHYLKEQRAAA